MRRTGRTTRMLADAVRLARQGRAVYVLAATHRHARQMADQLGEEGHLLGIKVEEFLPHVDWDLMELRGAHPNCELLVDHHAIERRFSRVLEMLHRYDEEADDESN